MYRKRRLGVKEGNAIEDIVAFEMRRDRGVATTADKLAHDKACQFLGIQETATSIVHPSMRGKIQNKTKSSSNAGPVPPINYIVNPASLKDYWWALKFVGSLFLLWLLSCFLLYMLVAVARELVSLAHP